MQTIPAARKISKHWFLRTGGRYHFSDDNIHHIITIQAFPGIWDVGSPVPGHTGRDVGKNAMWTDWIGYIENTAGFIGIAMYWHRKDSLQVDFFRKDIPRDPCFAKCSKSFR